MQINDGIKNKLVKVYKNCMVTVLHIDQCLYPTGSMYGIFVYSPIFSCFSW